MAVAFLPVLALEGQEGRLFHPLAYAKSLTMLIAALLAITLDPALRLTLAGLGRRDWGRRWWGRLMNSALRSEIRREEQHPLSRLLIRIYQPALLHALRHKGFVAAVVLIAAAITVPVYRRLGTEFIPPLDEGVLLYMPSTVSGISITEAKRLLQLTDARLKSQPEVAHVLGKAGRADTSTDAAPLSMLETVVVLKPREQWPRRMSQQELIAKFDAAMKFPGVANTWTMPVRGQDRHAGYRHAQSLGIEDRGAGPAERFRISESGWRNCCGTFAAPAASLPNGSTTAATSTSNGIAANWRARASRWRRPRRRCKTRSAATTSPPSFRGGRATR